MPLNLTGVWLKDSARSTPMDDAFNLIQLNMLMRQAIKLVRGVEIIQTDSFLKLSVFSGIPWFKVVETHAMDGSVATNMRRDLRAGGNTSRVELDEVDKVLRLHLEWADPCGGTLVDSMSLLDPDTLQVKAQLQVGSKEVWYTMVYTRKK